MSPALSVRQPWAWLIIRPDLTDPAERAAAFADGLIKDIENRDWKTPFRGRCLIHASKSGSKADYEDCLDFLADRGLDRILEIIPAIDQFDRGGIVGAVDIVGCTDTSDSPWFIGNFGFILRNPKPLPFVPWKGQLGFFNVQDGVNHGS